MKEGWEYKKLREVCNIEFGTRVVRSRDAGSMYPVYGGGGATFKMDTYNREDCMVISRFGMSEQCTRFVKGKFFLNDSGLTLSMKKDFMIQGFMDWQILYLNNTIYSLGRGAAQKNLDTKALAEVAIVYPNNLSEQQSIVDYLDSAFAKIDAMKANAEKALNEAKALFQASLKEMLEPKEGWEEKKLGEICTFSQGVQVPLQNQSLKESAGYTRFLRIIDFTQGSEPPRYVPINDAKYWMNHEDIAIVRYGASTGFICTGLEGTLANNLFRLNIKCDVSPHYLIYVLKSEIFQSVIKVQMNGAAMPAISFGLIEGIKMPIPSHSEQQSIVATLDSLKSKVDRLQANYDKISQECDALKQAILRQVFE